MKKYDIAAYVWPSYTGDEMRTRMFWPEGIGEWQTVKNSQPKPNGYFWDRKPLWGYVNEADPYVMEMQIKSAVDHGVNVFIYDWYWYDNRSFLENCLNDGFLKASNCNDMKFYLMWANHDVNHTWDIRNSDENEALIWQGAVGREQFEIIGRRWIEMYFSKENYYKIENKPVISIYDLKNFVEGLGGVQNSADAMKWLDDEAKKAGHNGVHFQYVCMDKLVSNVSGVDSTPIDIDAKLISEMGFESVTHYQYVHFTDIDRDYSEIMLDVVKEWERVEKKYGITYFPHVSIGWDNNPRFKDFRPGVVKNNTPEEIEKALRLAKEYADKKNVSLITINSWNEWTETSYLEPDDLYGYGYLEAIKQVFKDINN